MLQVLTYTDLEERKQLILLSSLLTWARMERPHTAGMGGGGAVGGPVQLMASLEPLDGPAITPPTANANVEVGGSAGGGWGGGVLGEDMRHKYTEDDYHGRRPAVRWMMEGGRRMGRGRSVLVWRGGRGRGAEEGVKGVS
jgi:hypothetical protein